MKKLLLTLGAVASVAAPVAAVVACGSNDSYKGLTFTSKDLGEDFQMDNTDLAQQVSDVAAELLSANATSSKTKNYVGELGGIKSLDFKFNGEKHTFNFLQDKFLKGGNAEQVQFQDAKDTGLSDKNANTALGMLSSMGDYKAIESKLKSLPFGEYDYVKPLASVISDANTPLAIDPVKGLVINKAWKDNYVILEDAERAAMNATPQVKATTDAAVKAVDDAIHGLEDKIRYVLRVMVASKTSLHEGAVYNDETKWVGFGWVTTNHFEK